VIMPSAENFMMRACDRIDSWIENNAKFMFYRFRMGIFIIRK
jgi:hypothetical protein